MTFSVQSGDPGTAQAGSGRILLGISLVLIAFNLRPVFSSLSAVLPEVMRSTGLSPAGASLLTTLPVLCLGLFAPLAPPLTRRFGAERAIFALLIVLALGTALRGLANVPALALGSIFAGGAIAVMNVLLPSLVKRDFPHRIPLMTGFYTMALCAGAALAAGATVPLRSALGGSWAAALASWSLPALLVLPLWAKQLPPRPNGESIGPVTVRGLWGDRLAWQVTLFMGLQSALAYIVFGWLAPILRERGLDPVKAGLVVSMSVLVQTAASMVAPILAGRSRDQRWICMAVLALALSGLMGILFAPISSVWLWAALQGGGQGGLFACAVMLMVLRAPDAFVAAELSSMAQSVGYVLAAGGPLLVGVLREWTGGFAASGPLFLALGLGIAWAGLGAGRALHVRATT